MAQSDLRLDLEVNKVPETHRTYTGADRRRASCMLACASAL
jgi:hypothetical protein